MADIDVVPKRGTKLWLWVIVALVILVVLWMMLGRGPSPASGRMHDSGTPATLAAVTMTPMSVTV